MCAAKFVAEICIAEIWIAAEMGTVARNFVQKLVGLQQLVSMYCSNPTNFTERVDKYIKHIFYCTH